MLEIRLCLDKPQIVSFCKKCKRIYSEALYSYIAIDRGQIIGAALFEVGGQNVRILYYETTETQDAFLLDGILRAGLNYASEHGIETGILPEALRQEYRSLFAKLNYPPTPEFNISNFFQKYKNCRI